MPSPRFGERVVADAVSMAIREAWACQQADRRPAVLSLALRRIMGEEAGEVMGAALKILEAQPRSPQTDVEPAGSMELALCARCRVVKLPEERAVPHNSPASLAFLRDAKWLTRQVEVLHLGDEEIARNLRCCKASVWIWRTRHGIRPGKEAKPHLQRDWLHQKLVVERLAPGEVATLAGVQAVEIRQLARDRGVGIEIRPYGHGRFAHHYAGWWVERCSRTPQPTQYALAKMAGIVTHAVLWHLRKYGLYNPDRDSKKRKPKHTQLYVPGWLQEQLQTRTTVEIAREVGCTEGNVRTARMKMQLANPRAPRPSSQCPWTHDPEWYRSRYPQRPTLQDLAQQAGCSVKSILNYMGELGLRREYAERVGRWSDEALRKTRVATLARQARQLVTA